MMDICPRCGEELTDGFCPVCGYPVEGKRIRVKTGRKTSPKVQETESNQ